MIPTKYSILYFKENFIQHCDQIGQFLSEGKKVFWFGAKWEVTQLKERYKPFADAFFCRHLTYQSYWKWIIWMVPRILPQR